MKLAYSNPCISTPNYICSKELLSYFFMLFHHVLFFFLRVINLNNNNYNGRHLPKFLIFGHNSKLNRTNDHVKDALCLRGGWSGRFVQTLGYFSFQQMSHWSKIFCNKKIKYINMPKVPLLNKTKYNNININNFIFKIIIKNLLTLFDKKYPNVSQKLLFVFKGIHRGKYFQHSHWRAPRSSVRGILQVPLIKKKPQIQKATLSQINRRPLSNYLHACSMCCTFSLIILIQYFLAYFRHSNRRCWRRKTPDFPLCVTDDLIISFCLMTVWQSWI